MSMKKTTRLRSYKNNSRRPTNTVYANGRTVLSEHFGLYEDIEAGFRYFMSKRDNLKRSDLL